MVSESIHMDNPLNYSCTNINGVIVCGSVLKKKDENRHDLKKVFKD
jgi:hypothetical protein